nr:phosphotransferase [Ruminococcus sp.]
MPTLFGLQEARKLTKFSTGHINSTFLAECGNKKYVLQSINKSVFQSPRVVMDNISRIEKAFADISDISVPHYISCGEKNYAVVNDDLWRIYCYIPSTSNAAIDVITAGRLFGSFIRIMDEWELNPTPVIDGFHDFDRYFATLSSKNGVDLNILTKLDKFRDTLEQVFTGSIKKRIIHGDAKPDNIIIGGTPTIIDLDTVMRGYVAIDYGDLVRSVCQGKELNIQQVREITQGFLQGLERLITTGEVNTLYYGVLWLTSELAVRYLIDSLSEVKYFRGKSSADCLTRAEELLRQLDMFTAHQEELKYVILSETD